MKKIKEGYHWIYQLKKKQIIGICWDLILSSFYQKSGFRRIFQRKGSRERAKRSGDNGHPCLVQLVTMKRGGGEQHSGFYHKTVNRNTHRILDALATLIKFRALIVSSHASRFRTNPTWSRWIREGNCCCSLKARKKVSRLYLRVKLAYSSHIVLGLYLLWVLL